MKNLLYKLRIFLVVLLSRLTDIVSKMKANGSLKPFAVITFLAGISTFISQNMPLIDKFEDMFLHDNVLVETSIVEQFTKSIDNNKLFSENNTFFYGLDNRLISINELIENADFSNEDMHVNIVPVNPKCTDKYIMVNESIDGHILHKILPVNNNSLESVWPGHSNANFLDGIFDDPVVDNYERLNKERIDMKQECLIEGTNFTLHENPGLQISINNNSVKNISINRVEIKVKRSEKNLFPFIQLSPAHPYSFPFVNEGWGEASNIEVKFNIQNTLRQVRYDAAFTYSVKIPSISPVRKDERQEYQEGMILRNFFIQEGVDVEALEKDGHFFSANEAHELYVNNQLGNFEFGEFRVVGLLIYDGQSPDRTIVRDTVKFNYINNLIFGGSGGFYEDEYRSTHNLKLENSSSNYNRKYNVTENIPPNSGKNFNLIFYSGHPSYHFFDLIIYYDQDKKLILKDIFLSEFYDHSRQYTLKSSLKRDKVVLKNNDH